MSSLTDDQIALQLQDLVGWERDGHSIIKTYVFEDFIRAIGFMTQAAFFAEALEHHPEWTNVYNKVTVRLGTHDTSSITSRDIQLAKRMESLVHHRS